MFKILSIKKLVFGIVFCSFVRHKMILIIFSVKSKQFFEIKVTEWDSSNENREFSFSVLKE